MGYCVCSQAWTFDVWLGKGSEFHYAIRAGSELARLNGLEPDGWQKVSEVGWPKDDDYPVWVWHPHKGLSWSNCAFPRKVPAAVNFAISENSKITHWQSMKSPEPPATTAAEDRIREADRKLEEVKKELEEARKAL